MDTINNGTIQVEFDESFIKRDFVVPVVKAFVSEKFGVDLEDSRTGVCFDPDGLKICFDDYHRNDIEDDLNELQKKLDPTRKKIWLESEYGIDVWSGGKESFVAVDHGVASYHDGSEYDLHYATDARLIAILRKRGYVVTKKEKAKC